jgi:cytochrome b involved in lipid metabolism
LAWASYDRILLDSERPNRKTIEKEEKNDPDRAPKGAKGSKKLEQRTGSKTGKSHTPGTGDLSVAEGKRYLTMEEVATHNLSNDAWVVVDGEVWE